MLGGVNDAPPPIRWLLESAAFGAVARAGLTLPYWWSGISKLTGIEGAFAEARHFGLEPAGLVVAATILVQIGASALLIAGRWAWLAAGALGAFTAAATLIAHRFWTIADPIARFHDTNTFLEHIGLIGGLALSAASAKRGNRS